MLEEQTEARVDSSFRLCVSSSLCWAVMMRVNLQKVPPASSPLLIIDLPCSRQRETAKGAWRSSVLDTNASQKGHWLAANWRFHPWFHASLALCLPDFWTFDNSEATEGQFSWFYPLPAPARWPHNNRTPAARSIDSKVASPQAQGLTVRQTSFWGSCCQGALMKLCR